MLARKWDKIDDSWCVCPQEREWEMDNPGYFLFLDGAVADDGTVGKKTAVSV